MAEQPNILLMVSDQHAHDVMGCAGDPLIRTPNLDALAERGTMFENAHCAAPLCVPSRMTMLTGRHCSEIGVWTNECYLDSDIPTFAHSLGAAGYETVLCGRMHFIGPDQRHGFHKRIMGGPGGHTHPGSCPPNMPGELLAATGQSYTAVACAGAGETAYQAYDEAVVVRSREWLQERAGSDDERPFLLTAGFVLPHCPFVAREDLYDYYYERIDVPEMPDGYLENLHPAMKEWRQSRGITDLTEEEIRKARAGYYGIVEHFDEVVGGMLQALEASGLGDDTIVVYVSDHGESAGRNGLWWKSQFYHHSVGVPMIMAGPGIPQATRSEIVSLLDLAPTFSELADAPDVPRGSGQSLLPLMHDRLCAPWRDEALAEMVNIGPRYPYPGRMIRRGPWKLMHYEGCEPLLFNLEEDPEEFDDRAQDRECRDVRAYLQDRLLEGWDPDKALRTLRLRREGQALLRDWLDAWEDMPIDPDYHHIPDEATTFGDGGTERA
ncbi:MAG: sulfatase-like hydrolase/transferase [Armatimonadota bacterium]